MNVHKDSRIHPALSVYPGALRALFDNPKNTCHFLLCRLKQKLLKTSAILSAMPHGNTVSTAERGSDSAGRSQQENEKGAEKKKLKNSKKNKSVSGDNTLQ